MIGVELKDFQEWAVAKLRTNFLVPIPNIPLYFQPQLAVEKQ